MDPTQQRERILHIQACAFRHGTTARSQMREKVAFRNDFGQCKGMYIVHVQCMRRPILRKTLRRNIFRGKTSQYEVWCFHDISAHFFTLHTKRVSQKLDLKTTNLRTWKSLRDYAMILMLLCDFHLNFCFPTAHWHREL